MRFTEISESTTSGSVSTVAMPLGKTQTRTQVAGLQPVQKVMGGTSKKKGPYGNSINESAELSEADLQEDDIILVPGQGRKMKTGFVPHGQSRLDHEVEMARSDLFSAAKNAQQVYAMIKDVSEDEGLEGWVQEKIIKANDYLNTIREYLEGKQIQQESVVEGAKVDRMVKHIEKSEKKLGKSKDEAENIAWATANKRGMLDNKNKKK
jgi:hypothetical protein